MLGSIQLRSCYLPFDLSQGSSQRPQSPGLGSGSVGVNGWIHDSVFWVVAIETFLGHASSLLETGVIDLPRGPEVME